MAGCPAVTALTIMLPGLHLDLHSAQKPQKANGFLIDFFNVCVSLQKGTRGPPQPQRQRAPAATMPREAEARPKVQHGLKSEGGGQTVEGRDVEEGEECILVVLVEDAFAHCRPVWSCCSPDARLLRGIGL